MHLTYDLLFTGNGIEINILFRLKSIFIVAQFREVSR